MKRAVVFAAGAAIVVAGLTGCSKKSDESDSQVTSSPSPVSATSGTVTGSVGAGSAKVTIDGNARQVQGQVACTRTGGNLNIAIGEQTTGIAVVMAQDASKVTSVGLGNVDGVVLGFQDQAPGGNATAKKDGDTYTVSGTATGIDMANPMQPITKSFEIEVSCP